MFAKVLLPYGRLNRTMGSRLASLAAAIVLAGAGTASVSEASPAGCADGTYPAAITAIDILDTTSQPVKVAVPLAPLLVRLTVRNCLQTPWIHDGDTPYRLGTAAPRDSFAFGTNRLNFAADVPAGGSAQVETWLRAPERPGVFPLRLAVVQEEVAWLPTVYEAPLPELIVALPSDPPALIPLCPALDPSIWADIHDQVPAAASIQRCVDLAAASSVVALPPGQYRIDQPIVLAKPLTLTTQGLANNGVGCGFGAQEQCATFVADPEFFAAGGMLQINATTDVHVDGIAFNGNRAARIGSRAEGMVDQNNRYGYNVRFLGCTNCSFTRSASVANLAGTALEWTGDAAQISGNLFQGNGVGASPSDFHWSDGLTIHDSANASVVYNRLLNNSDVGICLGGIPSGSVTDNTIIETDDAARPVLAGINLDNFNGVTSGDYRGAVIKNNTISCGGRYNCGFGINVGSHPWYEPKATDGSFLQVLGGEITGNKIKNARQGINVDGAGTPLAPLNLHDNAVLGFEVLPLWDCAHATSEINIAPEPHAYVVSREQSGSAGVTSMLWDLCVP